MYYEQEKKRLLEKKEAEEAAKAKIAKEKELAQMQIRIELGKRIKEQQ